MRLRLTIVAVLALGIAMAATGSAAAAPEYGTDASQAQYPPAFGEAPDGPPDRPDQLDPEPQPGPSGPVPPRSPGADNVPDREDKLPENDLLPPPVLVEQVKQVEAGSDALAFTGFAAIPVLLLGVALVGTGLALRRRGPRDD